jgi:hypothetical protein
MVTTWGRRRYRRKVDGVQIDELPRYHAIAASRDILRYRRLETSARRPACLHGGNVRLGRAQAARAADVRFVAGLSASELVGVEEHLPAGHAADPTRVTGVQRPSRSERAAISDPHAKTGCCTRPPRSTDADAVADTTLIQRRDGPWARCGRARSGRGA